MSILTKSHKITLLLLVISSLFCLLSLVIFDTGVLLRLYRQFGFHFLFLTTVYWGYVLLPSRAPAGIRLKFEWQSHGVLLLAFLLTGLMFLVSPHQFRILADETNLVSVSYSMFMGHSFANVTESLYFYEQHHPLSSTLDIRPNFYPFLIYLVHVVKGYSAYNGFVVNYIAGVASLWLVYSLLGRWFRWQIALLGMLMLAAFPVFVLWVTASGFEIVNLAMALLAFYLLHEYLEVRDSKNLEGLLLTLVLLAQTRYESAVFVIAIGAVLAISLRPTYLHSLPKRFAIIPWLFLPIAWHRLLKTDKADYQVYGDDQIFGIDNLVNNLPMALDYFTAGQEWYGTIALVFYLAVAGFLLALVKILLRRSAISPSGEYVFLAGSLSFLGLLVVVFSYYWGNLTYVFTLRLGIIFIPFLVVPACYLVSEILTLSVRWGIPAQFGKLSALMGISLVLWFWPVAGKNEAVEKLTLNRLYQSTLSFLQAEYPAHNNLIVTDRPGMYTVHQWGAVSTGYARNKYDSILEGLEKKLYQNVLVIQEVSYDTGLANEATEIPDVLHLETLFETQFDAEKAMRISRVVGRTEPKDGTGARAAED
jgi:hypothetical protein